MPHDSSLPSYKHPNYESSENWLRILLDCFDNLEGRKSDYLPKEAAEPQAVYAQRVAKSVFNNRLRPTIESSAGLLTEFELANQPVSVAASEGDIDRQGSDIKSFFLQSDVMALRDGYCYVLVDYPPASGAIQTLADQLQSSARPYLVLIDRRNVLNWRYHVEAGKMVIDHITIEFSTEIPDGLFGVKTQVRYHQLVRNDLGVEHIIWRIDEDQPQIKAVVESRNQTTLREIPIVCYPYSSKPFNSDIPPFLKLANLNIKLFRKESCLDEILHRVNVPTVWRKHPGDVPQNLPPVTLGGSWVLEIPEGGDVGVLEIAGTGVAALQVDIETLKKDIDAEGLAFLAGSTVQKTATESFLSSSQIQASLSGMMRNKASAIVKIFDYWCQYTGETNSIEVTYDHSLLEMPLDAQEMDVLLKLWQASALSHQTLLELLKMGRQLSPDTDIEQELERVEAERSRESQTILPSLDEVLGQAGDRSLNGARVN